MICDQPRPLASTTPRPYCQACGTNTCEHVNGPYVSHGSSDGSNDVSSWCQKTVAQADTTDGNGRVPVSQFVEDIGSTDTNAAENSYGTSTNNKHMSLWQYLYIELTRGYWLEHDKARFAERRKRVYTFMKIPRELEKFITYGFFQCVDGFLFIFTFLPLRFIKAIVRFCVRGCLATCWPTSGHLLDPAEICDLLKGIILIVCCVLMSYVDVSMMYHIIRGQTVIKLYIFFNMLDIADKLFSSFGQDILDALFWTATEARGRRREHIGVIPHLALAVVYVFLHSILVLLQANTLNVAFNSHNKALLTIMMSNNFVELKGSVFKKFERNNLFQMSCSDVRERFHLLFLLTIVGIRNLTEFNWNMDHFWVLIPDILLVMLSEFLIDWLKHAFITKFNEIPSEVYREYTLSIAYDVASSRHAYAFSDHLDTVSRRMGFIPLPLAVLLVRIVTQSFRFSSSLVCVVVVLFYLCFLTFKVLNSIVLLGKAHQYIDENRQLAAAMAAARYRDNYSEFAADTKVVSKDDLDLLPSGRTASLPSPCPDSPALLRRTQSLGEFIKEELPEPDSENQPVVGFIDPCGGFPRQTSFATNALLCNSTVSLNSVELNPSYVEERLGLLASAVPPGTPVRDTSSTTLTSDMLSTTRRRQRSSESGTLKDSDDGSATPPLSEVTRYTMCHNRII